MSVSLFNAVILISLFVVGFYLCTVPRPRHLAYALAAAVTLVFLALAATHLLVGTGGGLAGLSRLQGALVLCALLLPGLLLPVHTLLGWWGRVWPKRKSAELERTAPFGPDRPTWVAPPTGIARSTTLSGGDELPGGAVRPFELEGYEVLKRIGIGGMGSVYLARPKRGGPPLALKVPQERYLADQKFVTRFFREADILAKLNHPNVIKVFDYSAENGKFYIAMEYIDGISLERVLQERELKLIEAVQIFRALADAMRHIHLQKVIHRDLKPANVMLLRHAWDGEQLRRGAVKLMDFGVAVGQALSRLTMTGARVGTPTYMAPEQAKGIRTDARSDIYSLGLLGYELVTGQPAFEGTYESVVHQQVFEDPRPPNQLRHEIPSKLNDLILQMIEKDPAQRPTLDEVLRALDDDILAEDTFEESEVVLLGTDDPQTSLRLLDIDGKLRGNWGNLRGVNGAGELRLPSVPTALASYKGRVLMTFAPGRRKSGALVWVLDAAGNKVQAFGKFGLGEGELVRPIGIAQMEQKIFVLDAETSFVNVYRENGEYLFRFGGQGAGEGEFDLPLGLSASDEFLFVLDSGNHRLQRFSSRGEFVSRVAYRLGSNSDELRPLAGLCTDKDSVYMVDATDNRIRRVDMQGNSTAPVTLSREIGEPVDKPWLLAAGHSGRIYAVPQGGTLLRIYGAKGELVAQRNMYSPVQSLAFLHRSPAQLQEGLQKKADLLQLTATAGEAAP